MVWHRRVVAFSVILTIFGGAVGAAVAQNASPVLTAEQWRADLNYLAEQMPLRHKNLFHTMTPEAFRAAVDQLNADIPHLNGDEIAVRLMTIATLPEDSHTGGQGLPHGQCFPLRLRRYEDGLYVESAPARYAAAVGGRLIAIGDTPAEVVYEKMLALIAHDPENPGLLEVLGPVLMTMGPVLHGLDVTPTPDAATFVVRKDGKQLDLELSPAVSFETLFGHAPVPGWVDARGTAPSPTWLAHPDKTFWSAYLPATKTFYIQFNQVENAQDQTVAQFFERTFRAVHKLPVGKLVLDLRMNDGGNNYLLKPIIIGLIRLPRIDRPGHLFVVTSRNTYSAAQNLVNRLELYTDAIFVGQPTGEHVNSYGDAVPFALPNSHLRVGMASVWWQDTDERDKRIETDPMIAADPSFADYMANRDPAMDAILGYRPEASLEDGVLRGVKAAGVSGGLASYRAFAASPAHRYVRAHMERAVNVLGYKLVGDHRISEAVAVFTVNVEANPVSANALDSLGEAYLTEGDRAKAIESYQRALQLDPKLESSRAALQRLGAPQR